jgi:hypothetical protein
MLKALSPVGDHSFELCRRRFGASGWRADRTRGNRSPRRRAAG